MTDAVANNLKAKNPPRQAAAPLDTILCTAELWRRPQRPPDHEAENRALRELADALGKSPRTILQALAETLLKTLKAGSAGMSLLTDDGKDFYWAAIAGAWSPHLGGGTPRDFGPCGDVLDCGKPLLFKHWEWRYPYLAEATPLAEEGLLVPFFVDGKAVGTIWTIAHDHTRKFDAEDLRQIEGIARFASAAYQTIRLLNTNEASRVALEKLEESEDRFRQLLQALPAAVYTTDTQGRITFYNEAAVDFAGRRPELGELWCVTWRLYNPDGSRLPHEECPMAIALKEERQVRGAEAIAERPDGTRRWFVPFPTPLRDSSGGMTGAINMLVDITERKNAEREQRLLVDELNHRVKNTLAAVQSLILQTAKNAKDLADFQKAIEGRISALNHAHNQLSERNWMHVELAQLIRSGLSPYLSQGNVVLSGEAVQIMPRAALMVSMAVHELATNAAKYGALSCKNGRVQVSWGVKPHGPERVLRLSWLERGGPPVVKPSRQGFGTRLLARGIQMELQGSTSMEFEPSGIRCEIEMPASNLAG